MTTDNGGNAVHETLTSADDVLHVIETTLSRAQCVEFCDVSTFSLEIVRQQTRTRR